MPFARDGARLREHPELLGDGHAVRCRRVPAEVLDTPSAVSMRPSIKASKLSQLFDAKRFSSWCAG
jgi:hypothetical protein